MHYKYWLTTDIIDKLDDTIDNRSLQSNSFNYVILLIKSEYYPYT